MIQQVFEFKTLEPLKGTVANPEDARFSKKDWIDGTYQEKKELYINSMFGFRSFCIRLNNQIAFNLFNKAKANGVIVGKENYLYEESYINAYTGKDFLGEDSISHTLNRLKFISDTLSKLNKQLIIVFAAGKASYFPEYIPDKYLPISEKTNYKYLSDGAKKMGLNHIDFNKWFVDNKKTSKYPLYSLQGVHWSTYGTVLAADSLIRKIEFLRNIDTPNLLFDSIKMEDAHDVDYDVADGMNLLYRIDGFKMAYPKMRWVENLGKTKPKVLVISDSFYWGMYNLGISNCFQNDHFWYYNKQVFPESNSKEVLADDLDIKSQIESHDVFVIMATEATLRKISWGFIERVEFYFKNQSDLSKPIRTQEYMRSVKIFIESYIKTNKVWMETIVKMADEKKISPDSVMVIEAMWQIDHPNK